jgi:carbon-monoxide dehydrogenase medium subunit
MISAYHQPETLDEALHLLSNPDTRPLGGGTVINQPSNESHEVVDLQSLSLDKIHKAGDKLEIGSTVTLQSLLEYAHTPKVLQEVIRLETPPNLRNMGTIAGTLVVCDGRSPFAAVMLALDTKMIIKYSPTGTESHSILHEQINLGDFLPARAEILKGKLITKIEIPLNIKLAYEYVARTPMDKPIVCASLVQWPSGRTRMVIGGWGTSPFLAMDGKDFAGVESTALNAAHDAKDEWASAEYRREVARVLAKRCLEDISR